MNGWMGWGEMEQGGRGSRRAAEGGRALPLWVERRVQQQKNAYLAHGPKAPKHRPLHSLVDISIRKYEQRALAAQLQHRRPQVGGGRGVDRAPGGGGAGEGHLGHARVRAGAKRAWAVVGVSAEATAQLWSPCKAPRGAAHQSGAPVSGPNPVTMLSTPGGRPTSMQIWPSSVQGKECAGEEAGWHAGALGDRTCRQAAAGFAAAAELAAAAAATPHPGWSGWPALRA